MSDQIAHETPAFVQDFGAAGNEWAWMKKFLRQNLTK
jgi:hypothetical protein